MRPRLKRLASAIAFASCTLSGASYAALDNKGSEFILPFLPNYITNSSTLQIHLTSEVATDVLVEYPVNSPSFSTTVSVIPGDITVVDIPVGANFWTANAVANNAVHVTSDSEFVAYLLNLQTYTSDAALGLPIDVLNTDYIVASYSPLGSYGSQFLVYAAYDATDVTITQSTTSGGHTAGVPYTITLNRGEGFYMSGYGDLSGTIVEASRPVGMINGVQCANVPTGATACDHIFEIAQPTQSWGTDILAANLPNRPAGSIYRIFASQDNTTVSTDGGLLGTLNRGDFIEQSVTPGDHIYSGDKPIYVVQYMTGQDYPGQIRTGDPAMGNMVPFAQYQNSYTFSTVGGSQFAQQYLTIIAQNSDVGTLELDGSPVPASEFSAIGSTGYSAALVELTEGAHTTSSANNHGITVEGYNAYDSFIYPGGALFQFIDPTGDPWAPVCSATPAGESFNGLVTDNKPSEDVNGNDVLDAGEDTNSNGIIDADTGVFSVNSVVLDNATLSTTPFTPGDSQATFVVTRSDSSLPGSATISASDGAGNTCSIEVSFEIDTTPMACDLDGDHDVDMSDISIIRAARNTPASGPDDPLDIDGDGFITLNDARKCVLECTFSRCATAIP